MNSAIDAPRAEGPDKERLARLRRGITPTMRREILGDGEDLASCWYCGHIAHVVDHVIPVCQGGGLDRENLCPDEQAGGAPA